MDNSQRIFFAVNVIFIMETKKKKKKTKKEGKERHSQRRQLSMTSVSLEESVSIHLETVGVGGEREGGPAICTANFRAEEPGVVCTQVCGLGVGLATPPWNSLW